MAKLLAVPLKKSSEVDVVKPLRNLIQSAYNNPAGSSDYTESIADFGKLRNAAIWKFFEKYESSLDVVYGYYDQLCSLETKVPANELQIPFKWKDAFDKGSLFGGRISLTHTSLMYEKVCVLFNIAALQSAVAATQSMESDEGLKLATKLFQQAAGIFQYLKGATPAAIPSDPTPDLNPETLSVLASLMVAQAQELFIAKAIRDKLKDGMIAKLCVQCEELYADTLRGMQKDTVKAVWEKDWIPSVAGKQAGYHAMTQFFESLACRSSKRIGEEIARLQDAVDLFQAAQSRSGDPSLLNDYLVRAKRHLEEAIKDNNFIYNEMIPDVKTLPSPGKVQLAKPLSINSPMNPNFKDLFAELVPVVVHQAASACEARKNEAVNAGIMKLREGTQSLNGILSSLNLPAAIEMDCSGSGLPPSILTKAEDLRQKGGIESIQTLVKELPELLTRNREILDEAERMLTDEQRSDEQLRAQFKERWTRVPSEKLTEMFRSNARKYREIINNAVEADKTVRQKFEGHMKGIQLLSESPDKIQQALPSCEGVQIANNPAVQRLRQLMESVEAIKAERDVIESELKNVKIDMKSEFAQILAKEGTINEPALSLPQIGKVLQPLQAQVEDSVQRQQTLVSDIQEAHREFSAISGNSNVSRDGLLSELATAYDSFIELQNNLKEGTKFYNDLTQLLVVFQNKITDFCFARKTEKDELMKDLTQESSRQTPAPTPSIPTHYNTTTTTTDGGSMPQAQAPMAPPQGPTPYPMQISGMPVPYGATNTAPYPAYAAPPMPQGFNPYATLPYPTNAYNYSGFPQGPQPNQHYGTYPGSFASQQQGGYPYQQKPPGW